MSIDREICKIVRDRWPELGHKNTVPDQLVFFKVQGKLSKNASIIALIIDDSTQEPVAVAKIPRNPVSTFGIDSELAAMEALRHSAGSWEDDGSIPYHGFMTTVLGTKVLIQRAESGYSLVRDMTTQQNVQQAYSRVLPWMVAFHKSATEEIVLEGKMLKRYVTDPIAQFLEKVNALDNVQLSDSVMSYCNNLADTVAGSKVKLCHKHGDFNAHNILVTDVDNNTGMFVIDWEDYLSAQLPIHDLNHFFISNSKLLNMKYTAAQAFKAFMIEDGWYKEAYVNAVNNYEAEGFISADIFYKLTPLYMAEICLSMMSEQRQQEGTINVWLSRIERYIDDYLS